MDVAFGSKTFILSSLRWLVEVVRPTISLFLLFWVSFAKVTCTHFILLNCHIFWRWPYPKTTYLGTSGRGLLQPGFGLLKKKLWFHVFLAVNCLALLLRVPLSLSVLLIYWRKKKKKKKRKDHFDFVWYLERDQNSSPLVSTRQWKCFSGIRFQSFPIQCGRHVEISEIWYISHGWLLELYSTNYIASSIIFQIILNRAPLISRYPVRECSSR